MNLQGKKVLVTGAGGFIGSHLVEALVRMNYNVRAFVRYNSNNLWGWLDSAASDVKGQFQVFSGDVRDPNGVLEAMQGCDVVFHLAALIGIPFSYHSPDSYVDTNIRGTLNVLQAARKLNTTKVIHTSTSEVYGTAQQVPISETHRLQGQSPYSATKIGADQLALSFHLSFGTPVSIIRPFNTYGPRQSARAVIPTVIAQIASGERAVKLGATSPTRDFTFVEDTAAGFIAMAESDASVGEVINIGSGFEISVGDTAHLIADVMDTEVEILTDEQRVRPEESEVRRLYADTSKATELTGWKPLYAGTEGFRKGLEETVNWFTDKNNLKLYKSTLYNV